jgi:alpha-tubulin suppressor-like RCC1 family protein
MTLVGKPVGRALIGVLLLSGSVGAGLLATPQPAASSSPPNTLYAWGSGSAGQLGNGTTTAAQTTPVAVPLPAGVTATAIAAGADTGYALGSDGTVYAWGDGLAGQLGNDTTTSSTTPVVVSLPAGVTATAIAAGRKTGYAIGSDGTLYAWGYGVDGELGNGTNIIGGVATTPVAVALPVGITATAIAAGADTGYAIGSDGTLYAWGQGDRGELGNGTTTVIQDSPVAVSLAPGVVPTAIAAGQETAYAIGSDGQLYAWGYGGAGELGNGTMSSTSFQTTPVAVSLPSGVTPTTIAAGYFDGYAVGSDGVLYAWGYGFDGELGNGTQGPFQTTPDAVSLPAGVTATAIGAGQLTGYALGSDGTLYAWGSGANGQLGNGTMTSFQTTPVAVSLPSGEVPGPEPASLSGYAITRPAVTSHQVTISTVSLPDGSLGKPYLFQLQATGGTPPYTWNKYGPKGMAKLPRGVSLSRSGLISGTPKRAGTYGFVVKCLDSSHSHKTQGTQELTLTVNP